ncbi:MAG: hypothetical protein BGO98_31060 [Myxococcales bacterium 68-20]|nr:MAG: hypothetical protein BGO98_31060 [Myxococcales bacterium 68-20]
MLVLALVFSAKVSFAAESPPVRISESLHQGCPKQPSMRERIKAHLGTIRDARPDELAIEVAFRIERRNALSHGTVTLSLGGVSTERKASSKSCADVVAALSMMAAIAIGEEAERLSSELPEEPPTAVDEPSPLPASSRAAPSSDAHPVQVQPMPSAARPQAKAGHVDRLRGALGTGIELNGNRELVLMPTGFAQLTFPARFDPVVRVGLARSFRGRASSSRGEVAIRWSVIKLAGCADVLRAEAFRLGSCLVGELGLLEAAKVDPLPAREFSYFWLSLGASAKAAWRLLPGFYIETMVGARVPVTQRELYFNPYTEPLAYKSPLVVPFAAVSLVAQVP